MNKMLKVLGAVFLAILVGVVALIGYAAYSGPKLDASSKAYVDQVVPIIVSTWSPEEVLKRASPQFRQAVNDEQLKELLVKLSKLGRLERYEGSKGDSNVSFTSQAGKVISATYVANAKFENGDAQINIRIIQLGGQWRLLSFYVNSLIFLKPIERQS